VIFLEDLDILYSSQPDVPPGLPLDVVSIVHRGVGIPVVWVVLSKSGASDAGERTAVIAILQTRRQFELPTRCERFLNHRNPAPALPT